MTRPAVHQSPPASSPSHLRWTAALCRLRDACILALSHYLLCHHYSQKAPCPSHVSRCHCATHTLKSPSPTTPRLREACPRQDFLYQVSLVAGDHFGDQGSATLSSHDIIRPTFAFLLMECKRRIPGRPIRCSALCFAGAWIVCSSMTVLLPAALGTLGRCLFSKAYITCNLEILSSAIVTLVFAMIDTPVCGGLFCLFSPKPRMSRADVARVKRNIKPSPSREATPCREFRELAGSVAASS